MRIGFITCVRLGESCLEELASHGANLVYLGTIRDEIAQNKSGRIYLDSFAAEHQIPLHKFRNLNDADSVEAIRAADLDWLYVIGWSQMARAEVLSVPRHGVLGIHPTLLPEGRGRASIPWTIIKGLPQTGVTMFKLDEGMDTGPVLGQVVIPVAGDETSTSLYEKVVAAHRVLIRETYPGIATGTITAVPQDESRATEWPARKPSDGHLEPLLMTSADVDRTVRALTRPYPGAFVRLDDGQVIRIWEGTVDPSVEGHGLETGDGTYIVTRYDLEPVENSP